MYEGLPSIRCCLSPDTFNATNIIISMVTDISRILRSSLSTLLRTPSFHLPEARDILGYPQTVFRDEKSRVKWYCYRPDILTLTQGLE